MIQGLLATSSTGAVGGGGVTVTLTSVAPLVVAGTAGTFGNSTALTVGGTATAWTWSVIAQSGGTFSISGGAGTATATAAVTGVVGASATALLQCLVIASATAYTVTTPLSFTNSTVVSVSIESVPAKTGVTGSVLFNASSITVTGGTASSYVWSILSMVNGTFSANGGQGTAVFGSQVSGVAAGTTATATLQCVVTVGGTPYVVTTPLSYQNTAGTGSLSVDVSPLTQTASGSAATVTSGVFNTALSGGTGPYNYAWLCTANTGGFPNTNFTGVNATSASTTLRAVGLDASDGDVVASFQVTVTDSLAATAVGTCTVTFRTTFNP